MLTSKFATFFFFLCVCMCMYSENVYYRIGPSPLLFFSLILHTHTHACVPMRSRPYSVHNLHKCVFFFFLYQRVLSNADVLLHLHIASFLLCLFFLSFPFFFLLLLYFSDLLVSFLVRLILLVVSFVFGFFFFVVVVVFSLEKSTKKLLFFFL